MIRCLNTSCGSYHVSDETVSVNPRTGKAFRKHPFWWGFGVGWALTFVGVLFTFLLSPIVTTLGQEGASNPGASVLQLLILLLGVVLESAFITFPLWGIIQVARKATSGVKEHHYSCSTCGYKWVWREGTPAPAPPGTYHPNPALYAAEQQRNIAAAADAYQRQLRGEI